MSDFNALPEDLQKKLLQWDKNSPQNKQIQLLSDVADMVQELLGVMDEGKKQGEKATGDFGALLMDMRDSLGALKDKQDPQTPDYAKPVVAAVSKLEVSLTKALNAIDVKPEFTPNIQVDAPQVNVSPPHVDLKGVEKILKTDIPKAFREAIGQIPQTEVPDADYTEIISKLDSLNETLQAIEQVSRLKPVAPNNVGINANGAVVSDANPLPVSAEVVIPPITVDSAPTFKDDPTDTLETPKYGKTNSSTHKQQIEADVGTSITSLPLPTGAATSALQTQPGIDIGDVTINNASGAAAVNIQDGGNSITVDGAITATLAAETTKVIGTVNQGTSPWVSQVTSLTPGTSNALLGAAVDSPATGTKTGVLAIAVRDDVLATLTPVDNDYTEHRVDSTGALWSHVTNIDAQALPTGASTSALQTSGNASLASIDTKLTSPITAGKKMGTSTPATNVSTSTTVATLLALNTSRVKATIYNDSTTGMLLIKEGSAASATSFHYALSPATATSPGGQAIIDDYSGIITGILTTGTGTARVGETS